VNCESGAAPPTRHRGLLVASTMLATLLYTIDATIANVALPHIQGDLQATQDQIAWVLTAYLLASAVATPLSGYLALRYGQRPVMLFSVIGFTVASALCGLATSLPELVAFRFLKGLAGAGLIPLSQIVLMSAYPRERLSWALALWGSGIMVGPVIGPLLGGVLTDALSWRWVFYVNLPVGVFAALGLAASVPKGAATPARRFDTTGFLLLALALGLGQLGLDRGNSLGWFESPEVAAELFLAALFLYMFVSHALTARAQPFVDPHLFRDRNFVAGLVTSFGMGMMVFGVTALLPLLTQQLLGHTAIQAGVMMIPRGLGTLAAMLLGGRLLERIEPRLLAVSGVVLMALSCIPMLDTSLDLGDAAIMWCAFLSGAGVGLLFVPLTTLAFATLPASQHTEAGVVMSLARNVGSTVGISIMLMMLARWTQTNQSRLVEYLTPFDWERWLPFQQAVGDQAAPVVTQVVLRQAAAIAYANDFALMLALTLLAAPGLLLFRRSRATRQRTSTAMLTRTD
jgi:DHA2 family multidrug resistance protein